MQLLLIAPVSINSRLEKAHTDTLTEENHISSNLNAIFLCELSTHSNAYQIPVRLFVVALSVIVNRARNCQNPPFVSHKISRYLCGSTESIFWQAVWKLRLNPKITCYRQINTQWFLLPSETTEIHQTVSKPVEANHKTIFYLGKSNKIFCCFF